MRQLVPDARRLFRLILPWIVFVWTALPVHACGSGMAAMDEGCPLCPPQAAKQAASLAAHCATAVPRAIGTRHPADAPPVAIGLAGFALPEFRPRFRGQPLRIARAPPGHRPLHLVKQVLLV